MSQYQRIATEYSLILTDTVSLDRVRREIIDKLDFTASVSSVLDVGCGEGSYLAAVTELVPTLKRAVGVDASPEMVRLAKARGSRAEFLLADMNALPFGGETFDRVYARHALHYSLDLTATMAEIARVTVPGGLFHFRDVHPIMALFRKPSRDYEIRENASFPVHEDDNLTVEHPCLTFADYLEAITASSLQIVSVKEGFGRLAEATAPFRIPTYIRFTLRKSL